MSESVIHHKLVLRLIGYIQNTVGSDLKCFIQADNCRGFVLSPQMDDGFRPDVYFEYGDVLIIGEAKTNLDVSRQHSINQYRSYLKTCQNYHGKALFIMTVPYLSYAETNNIIKKIKKEFPGNYQVKIHGEFI